MSIPGTQHLSPTSPSPRPPHLASRPPPQAVGISLCVAGFGESMVELLDLSWSWSEKAFAAGALLLLALINVAGVKWVIKVQFLLLLLVLLAALDFIFGSFLDHSDGESGNPLCCESCWTSSFIPAVLREHLTAESPRNEAAEVSTADYKSFRIPANVYKALWNRFLQ